jgi:hypothetical protein
MAGRASRRLDGCSCGVAGVSCDRFAAAANPRITHCVRCGRSEAAHVPVRRRNLEFERQLTAEAARGWCEPSALVEFAEARAAAGREYGDPGCVRLDRDMLREARAELADARNYLCWWLETHVGDEGAARVLEALRWVALAFDRLLE